jgi:hypothetical protein
MATPTVTAAAIIHIVAVCACEREGYEVVPLGVAGGEQLGMDSECIEVARRAFRGPA